MRNGIIIFVIVVLAAGSFAGIVFYRKGAQKDSRISDQLKQIEALNKKISMLDQDAASLQKQSVSAQKKIKSLEDEKQHVAQLREKLDEKDEALAAEKKKFDALRNSMRNLEAKLEYEQASLKSQGENLQMARTQIEHLTAELEDNNRSRIDLKTQTVDLKDRLIKGQEEYQSLSMKLLKEQSEKQALKRELAQAHDDITSEQIACQNQQKSLEEAQSQIIDLTGMVEQAKAEQTIINGRLSTLETEKAECEKNLSGLNTKLQTVKTDRYESQLAIQRQQKALETAQSEIVRLKSEVQKNQAVKVILEKEVSGFKTQLLDLKDTHQRVQTLQKEIQKTADINSHLKDQISILQIQLNNYQEKTLTYSSTIEEKDSQLKQIVSNLNNCLVNSKDVEASLQTAQSQIMNLTGMVEQARARQVVLSRKVSNLESEKAEMAMKLTEVRKTYDTLIESLHDKIETKEAVLEDCEKKFSVTFIERILFFSGKAGISISGQRVLKKAGDILSKMRFGVIRIAGHTDNIPIRRGWRGRFPTNWELSSARSAAVARFFQKESNISPEKMEVIGFGAHRPVASNETTEGRAKNRRVEITIAPMASMLRTTP